MRYRRRDQRRVNAETNTSPRRAYGAYTARRFSGARIYVLPWGANCSARIETPQALRGMSGHIIDESVEQTLISQISRVPVYLFM